MRTFKTYRADLWGNPVEGYEVNDWYPKETIELEAIDENDDQLIKDLIAVGFFNEEASRAYYDVEASEIDLDGKDNWGLEILITFTDAHGHEEIFKLSEVV